MKTIGLMADPGLPDKIAQSLKRTLDVAHSADSPETTRAREESDEAWTIEVSRDSLALDANGEVPLVDHARHLLEEHDWDHVIYITDLPLWRRGRPIVFEIVQQESAALVCLPALGLLRLRHRTRRLLLKIVRTMVTGGAPADLAPFGGRQTLHENQDDSDNEYALMGGRTHKWRLLLGMIRSNQPGRLLPAMSSAVAAATATGAFGIFYASVWNMADELPTQRLAFISALVIGALSAWLIVRNGLWNSGRRSTAGARGRRDNAATVITIGISATMMYALLFLGLFVAGLIVIASSYLESQLGHPVTIADYLQLSWLAASLGTMAGALGSNFDSEEAIREATYSRRQHERRKLAEAQEPTE